MTGLDRRGIRALVFLDVPRAVDLVTRTADREGVRLVHTSDVHLGDRMRGDAPRRALTSVVEASNAARAQVLLVAGDLFDSARVSDGIVADAIDELSRCEGHVVILPGNHDAHDESSIYRRDVWLRRARHLRVLGERPSTFRDLDLEVWGRPVVEHTPRFRPLAAIPPREGSRLRVIAAHGHVVLDARSQHDHVRSSPIHLEEIGEADCDYVALGHWDLRTDVSHGGTTAFYSGAPYSPEGDLTEALLVTVRRGRSPLVAPLPLRNGLR